MRHKLMAAILSSSVMNLSMITASLGQAQQTGIKSNSVNEEVSSSEINCNHAGLHNHNSLAFCIPLEYSKLQPPSVFNISENVITFEPLDIKIVDIDEKTNTITYKMFLVIFWTDSRIVLRDDIADDDTFNPTSLKVSEHLWLPDAYIDNIVSSTNFDLITEMASLKVNGASRFRYRKIRSMK